MPRRLAAPLILLGLLASCLDLSGPGEPLHVEWQNRSPEGLPYPHTVRVVDGRLEIAGQIHTGYSNCHVETASLSRSGSTLHLRLDLWVSNLPSLGGCGFEARTSPIPRGEYTLLVTYHSEGNAWEAERQAVVVR